MKLIEKLNDKIAEEINDAKCYAKMALEYKDSNRTLADTLYTISTEEMRHMNLLHSEVVRTIEEYRRSNGEPPPEMLAIYEYLHGKHIEAAAEVKALHALYKE